MLQLWWATLHQSASHKKAKGMGFFLAPIVAMEPESVNGVTEDDEWEEVKLAVDSGTTETMIPPDILEDVELRQGAPYKGGLEYEVANGVHIPNLQESQQKDQ